MSLKTPHRISGVRTWDACMTDEAVRRSVNAPRPLLNEEEKGGGGCKRGFNGIRPRGGGGC